jgi:large subunit ribosomal protein L32
MPVPKRKTSKSRRDKRHSTRFIRPQAITVCSHCTSPLLPHQACDACGFYKGKKVMLTKLDRGVKRSELRSARANAASKEQGAGSEPSV